MTVLTVTVNAVKLFLMDEQEMTIDELAAAAQVPSRTIREYQRLGLLPPPRKENRVGIYGEPHRSRLGVIARLQGRGYSLAAIGDLLNNWEAGRGLGSVLGADANPAVLDEVPTEMALAELIELAPCLAQVAQRARLESAGVIVARNGERVIVRSVAAIELIGTGELIGMDADAAVALALDVRDGAAAIADAVIGSFLAQVWDQRPDDVELVTFMRRARLLLAQSAASLVVDRLGGALETAVNSREDAELRSLLGEIGIGAVRLLPTPDDLDSTR